MWEGFVYPGNVLILDRVIAPCQDARASRVASPYATPARPGTFPRYIPSSRPKWSDLSFPETWPADNNPAARQSSVEPTHLIRAIRPITRAGTGTRPYQGTAVSRRSPLSLWGEGLGVRRSGRPSTQLIAGNPRTPQGVVAHGFNLGFSPTPTPPGGHP